MDCLGPHAVERVGGLRPGTRLNKINRPRVQQRASKTSAMTTALPQQLHINGNKKSNIKNKYIEAYIVEINI